MPGFRCWQQPLAGISLTSDDDLACRMLSYRMLLAAILRRMFSGERHRLTWTLPRRKVALFSLGRSSDYQLRRMLRQVTAG